MQKYFDHFKTSHNSQLNSDDFSAIIINHKLHKSACNKTLSRLQLCQARRLDKENEWT